MEEDDLIRRFFQWTCKKKEILDHLSNHGIEMPLRTLQRRLHNLGLFRRKFYTNLHEVYRFIWEQLQGSGASHGIRWMHLKCNLNGFNVTRDVVAQCLHDLDPEGIEVRSRRRLRRRVYHANGPNWLWHVDGYDKLKRYGLCIQGCIDGYSRLLIWLRVGSSNNNPYLMAGYYIEAVESLGGIPMTVRSDLGTENGHTRDIQTDLRFDHYRNGRPAFLQGRSTNNQRIESWWGILRRQNAEYWMNLFLNLDNAGHFSGSYLDKNLIRFFFLPLIQEELNEVATVWNAHLIRRSKNATSPSGKPVNMFFTPWRYNAHNYLLPVADDDISRWKQTCQFEDLPCCDSRIHDDITHIMVRDQLHVEESVANAMENYLHVRREIISNYSSGNLQIDPLNDG